MLLKQLKHLEIMFLMVVKNIISVFPTKSTLILRDISVTRLQIPIMLGFAVTDYKVQGTLFQTVILDLYKKFNSKSGGLY